MHRDFNNIFSPDSKVLIVDDCAIYRTATKGMLLKLGFRTSQVLIAVDAPSAITLTIEHEFDLVLCDYNLNHQVNGQQLIDTLKSRKLLKADCAIIVITADSSAASVRRFAELGCDGYLVKPLNFNTFRERLPKLCEKKRKLSVIHLLLAKNAFEKAIIASVKLRKVHAKLSDYIRYLQSQGFIGLNKLSEAEHILKTLLSTGEVSAASLLLAKVYIAQEKQQDALQCLSLGFNDPIFAATAKYQSAQILLMQDDANKAIQFLNEAISLSSSNIHYIELKAMLAMAIGDFYLAFETVRSYFSKVNKSDMNSMDPYFRLAQSGLDMIEFCNNNKAFSELDFKNLCSKWRQELPKEIYLRLELLLFARFYAISNSDKKSEEKLSQYREIVQKQDGPTSLSENIELVKTLNKLNKNSESKILHEEIIQQVLSQSEAMDSYDDSVKLRCVELYYRTLVGIKEQQRVEAKKCFDNGVVEFNSGSYEKSLLSLLHARQIESGNSDTSFYLIKSLSHTLPVGWKRADVMSLVVQLKHELGKRINELTKELKILAEKLKEPSIALITPK